MPTPIKELQEIRNLYTYFVLSLGLDYRGLKALVVALNYYLPREYALLYYHHILEVEGGQYLDGIKWTFPGTGQNKLAYCKTTLKAGCVQEFTFSSETFKSQTYVYVNSRWLFIKAHLDQFSVVLAKIRSVHSAPQNQ